MRPRRCPAQSHRPSPCTNRVGDDRRIRPLHAPLSRQSQRPGRANPHTLAHCPWSVWDPCKPSARAGRQSSWGERQRRLVHFLIQHFTHSVAAPRRNWPAPVDGYALLILPLPWTPGACHSLSMALDPTLGLYRHPGTARQESRVFDATCADIKTAPAVSPGMGAHLDRTDPIDNHLPVWGEAS